MTLPPAPSGADESTVDPASGFAGRARQAVAWMTGFTLFRDLLQFGVMLVLVRLLPAEVYGQFGLLTTLLGFLTLFSLREFLGHTLVVRDRERAHFQDQFTAGLWVQAGVFVLANLIALGLRWFPAYAEVGSALHVMSVLFLLSLPSELRTKMLERELNWRRLRLLHGTALAAGAALSIALAAWGWGVYALLVPTLLVPLPFIYDLFVRERWRPSLAFSWDRFRPAWRFGSARILGLSFVSGAALLESSWMAQAFGFAALGLFGRAIGLTHLLCGRVAGLLSLSVYPVLTRIPPRSDAYRRASALYLRTVAWTIVPAATLAALLADPLVRTLYGGDWIGVIPMLPWAMAGGALAGVVQTGYTLLLAHERQDRCVWVDAWRLAGTALALGTLLGFGINAYLGGLIVVHGVALALVLFWLRDDRAVAAAGLSQALIPPATATLVAMAVALAAGRGSAATPLVRSGMEALVFAACYLAVLRLVYPRQLAELVSQMPQPQHLTRLLRLQGA